MENMDRTFNRLPVLLLVLLLMTVSQRLSVAQQVKEPRKLAFIVGVSEYQKDGLTNLRYAHKDANDLSTELTNNGFEVTKLIGNDAKHKDVRSQLQQFVTATGQLDKNDVVLVSFSGHGVQKIVKTENRLVETPFFCVRDTLTSNPATMISLNWVLEELKAKSGCSNNLLIVDACRNNPDKGARTLDGSTVKELPTKISMLFSSSAGQKSFESEKVKQGVFTHVLLKGLRGDAANSRGQIKWASLATYVLEEVPDTAAELLNDASIDQRPNLVGNIVRSPVLNSATRVPLLVSPFDKHEVDIAITALGRAKGMKSVVKNDIGMEFRLIPAGKFMMGSPESEKERNKDELQHEVEISRPFYMGTYEVTQSEWEKVMGENPSYFSKQGKRADHVKGLDTSTFPVEQVSWEDAQKFIAHLNARHGVPGYRYGLPSEAQWEYACRAGSDTAFHFGDVLTGKGANCAGLSPYGSKTEGPFLDRTCKVGSYKANNFGLHDMSGNVLEWCSDWYGKDTYSQSPLRDPEGPASGASRVLRGGTWCMEAARCRSATRYRHMKFFLTHVIGFRVVLSVGG